MTDSPYLKKEIKNHPEPEYLNDLRILRRFIQSGSFGYRASKNVVFLRLKNRYPEAYTAIGEERKQEVLEKYQDSPYIDCQIRTYPNNPDKPDYLKSLKRLRHVMILFKLGYGSREMNMLRVNSRRQYPEAFEAFEEELGDL